MYSASHAETVEELLQWPWKRFDAFYGSYTKRRAVEALDRRKDALTAALWANDGFNDDKGTRAQAIDDLERHYEEAVYRILGPAEPEEEIDKDNPFFAAMDKGISQLHARVSPDSSVSDVVEREEFSKYIDQG